MIRSHTFQQAMARLALVATLLLVLLPTLGRLAAHAPDAPQPGWNAMCTAAGLELVASKTAARPAGPAIRSESQGHAHDSPAPHRHDDADCDYCPLLASLLAAASCALLLLSQTLRTAVSGLRLVFHRAAFHPCGLGSRGPPIAL